MKPLKVDWYEGWDLDHSYFAEYLTIFLQNATVQSISGTGALRIGAAFFVRPGNTILFFSY